MYRALEFQTIGLLALGLAAISAIARGFWLYRASLTWPTADGVITRMDIERHRDANMHGGHYFCATFSYDFHDPAANRQHGTWYKNFSSAEEARQFPERELPVGKRVVVRFNPKKPAFNDLELDSGTYTGDRPTTLSI
jgi:Protein of unknown function (DUF3592)